MNKDYCIFHPFLNKKDYITLKDLYNITKLTAHELFDLINKQVLLKNLGYIIHSRDLGTFLSSFNEEQLWVRLSIPSPCDYEINCCGVVRRILPNGSKGKPLKPQLNKTENRYYVNLVINNKRVHLYLDAAVIYHFTSEKYNAYDPIIHIDNDISNLHYSNLKSIPGHISSDERWTYLNREGSTYELSNHGRVRTIINYRYHYLKLTPKGYSGSLNVHLSLPGNRGFFSVSRLVAEHFIKGFSEDLIVSFIDEDNKNCYYKNLILFTNQEFGRIVATKNRTYPKVLCIEKSTGIPIDTFNSVKEAARNLNISYQCIFDNLNGKSKLVLKKYIFKYEQQHT